MNDKSIDHEISALIKAAKAGAGDAAHALGGRYREGNGVPQDIVHALHWYEVGAKLGDAGAQNDFGSMLLNGLGCPADAQIATHWYAESAKQGFSIAQYNLGKRFLHGDGADLDDEQAFYWIAKAADQGHLEARCELGTLYRFGRGTAADVLQAAEYHISCAEAGDAVAHGNLCDEKVELTRLALEGNRQAAFALCRVYSVGLGVDKQPAVSWSWMRWAHDGCDPLPEGADPWGINWDVANAMSFYLTYVAKDTRTEGDLLLAERLSAAGIKPEGGQRIILRVGGEGGVLTLSGRWAAAGWRFQVHDWTPEMEDGAAIAHELDDIRSWRSAMKTMDRNSWHALYPLEAHPEFGEKIWQARQRRCKVHCLDRYEEEWKRVCRGIESDVSLIEGGGESDASSNTTRDGLTEYSKCGASQPDGEDPAIACARRMLEMVAILHKMGYEQLRIFPIIGMSGMAWRCRVLPAGLMSRENGALPVDEDIVPDGRNCAYFSTNMPTKFFGLIVPGTLTPRQLAEDFIAEYPEIVQLGRGADPEYAAWYREMLILTAPSNLLWVTSDAMGDDDYMRPGKLSTAGPHIDLYLDMPPPFRSR